MARTIDDRLSRLQARRKGMDRLAVLDEAVQDEFVRKSFTQETWEKRALTQPNTRYALGAMQAVGADYTAKSVETAMKVGAHFDDGACGRSVRHQMQGSVPLDVHIRGISDVDLLVLDTWFFTYERGGVRDLLGGYRNPTSETSPGVLSSLRSGAEALLNRRYWSATVDCTGAKCISLSGASLARTVDVVPAHWHDTHAYQQGNGEHHRGVTIFNKHTNTTIDNLPFLHIHEVSARDAMVEGTLKKAIRLVKTLKSDVQDEAAAAKLPSFDIAGLLYHADLDALAEGRYAELAVLGEAQRFISWCCDNPILAKTFLTPDRSRTILDNNDKMVGLNAVNEELTDLLIRVAAEQNFLAGLAGLDATGARRIAKAARVPAAA